MARARAQKNLLSSIAGLSEDAIQKLPDLPGADKLLAGLGTMRDRMDDMQKRLRGLEGLEQRLVGLEKRVAKLEGKGSSPAARKTTSTARKTTSTKSSGGTASKKR